MKTLILAVATVSVFAAPLSAFSQSDATPTRAQVKAELQQFEQAGYRPSGEESSYPANEQAAEARVATETEYGGMTTGSSGSGARSDVQPASADQLRQLYMGGQ